MYSWVMMCGLCVSRVCARVVMGSFVNYVTRDEYGCEGVSPKNFRAWRGSRKGKMERDAGPQYTEKGKGEQRDANERDG